MSRRQRKLVKSHKFWNSRRQTQKRLAASRICAFVSETDLRPYAVVRIGKFESKGLLDSGASVRCLGKDCDELLKNLNVSFKPITSNVLTADGTAQKVTGVVKVDITYLNKTKPIELFIVPSLTQELILGIDFWKEFGIAPAIVSEVKVDVPLVENVHDLTPSQQAFLDQVKAKFPSFAVEGLGKTSVLSHKIDVKGAEPIKKRHYPVSPAIQKIMYEEVDRMISLGVIEESKSAWSSPIVLVRKSNGKARLWLDSRALNSVTVKDAFPMPNLEEIIGRLGSTRYISSIDLKDAFWQIPLSDDSKKKTAFAIPGRPLYQFTRMPFGLCNAAQAMCRLMDRVIPNEIRESVFVFIDDLLVVSPDFESHMKLLEKVAFHLREANLTINVEKSKFVMKQVKYLGYIVGDGCIKTDPDKVKAIVDFEAPKKVKQVRRFLGMCGWYRRFISNYSAISSPISNLLKKSDKFAWTEEAQESFLQLKQYLISAPVLANPDFSKPFVLQCDASLTGVGCVLYQVGDDGHEHPIAYMSQKLNSPKGTTV